MKSAALTMSAAAVLAAALIGPAPLAASNAIAKAEGLACTVCHDKPGSKLLTDQGKYYELMSSLDGFSEIHASFGKCTSCHVRKPGSRKLTKQGKRFQGMIEDMEGLRELVLHEHPEPAAPIPGQAAASDSAAPPAAGSSEPLVD